ncbi:DUF1622 domain-containing protein [Oceanivirga salmonicida]|uniref:DUF1622 domain-containing protein n=1 Tax=Oceanivirga salmonicida TaxID=1769291 RepID=UPI000830C8F9|nr:DUF1622 domain-containing protein [Oceanivirga salmonicida]
MKEIIEFIVPFASNCLELVGVIIVIIGSINSLIKLITSKFDLNNVKIKLQLIKALELSLEFKLAAELLKTVLIRTVDELLILSAIVILRVIMTFVIHWEITNYKKRDEL